MNALYLTLFVSLVLAAGSVILFLWGFSRRDQDHTDRLSLLPLDDVDASPLVPGSPLPTPRKMEMP